MFDIGWGEMLLIAIVALVVVGPKDLPVMFRTFGQFMGRARSMAREFQRSLEQAANESGINEATKELRALDKLNLNSATRSARRYADRLLDETDAPPKGAEAKSAKSGEKTKGQAEQAPAVAPAVADAAEPAPAETARTDERPDQVN